MAEATGQATHSRPSHQPLAAYLKQLTEEIHQNLQSVADDGRQFLEHCKQKCSSLQLSVEEPDIKADTLREALQATARMVLDYTYLDETLLVDAEFPPDSASRRIAAIQEHLDKLCQVAKDIFENQEVVETLGEDIVECIHWRKGALLYMYCHTLENKERQPEPGHYRQCLQEGVQQLEKMLSTRQPTPVPSDVSFDDTLQLFSQGVYSDTHLLAMMYAAEMCYWHQQAVDRGLFTAGTGDLSAFCSRQQGLHYLNSFLKAVSGPLKGQGWSTSRAEEFVQYFQQGP